MPTDGLYLVDCSRGSEGKRALMFFKNMQPGGNDFQTPDAIVDLDQVSSSGNLGVWETGTTQSATFSSGVKFEFNIAVGANFKNTGDPVGASDNGFENFTVFKDNNRVIFRTADGFACKSVYFAH